MLRQELEADVLIKPWRMAVLVESRRIFLREKEGIAQKSLNHVELGTTRVLYHAHILYFFQLLIQIELVYSSHRQGKED